MAVSRSTTLDSMLKYWWVATHRQSIVPCWRRIRKRMTLTLVHVRTFWGHERAGWRIVGGSWWFENIRLFYLNRFNHRSISYRAWGGLLWPAWPRLLCQPCQILQQHLRGWHIRRCPSPSVVEVISKTARTEAWNLRHGTNRLGVRHGLGAG